MLTHMEIGMWWSGLVARGVVVFEQALPRSGGLQ